MARRPKTPRWLSAARESGAAGGDWLLRALGRAGAVAPTELPKAIESGRVKVDGKVMKKPFAPVSEASKVTVDGALVSLKRRTRVLMLHKPAGVVAAGSGREKRPTVFDVLAPLLSQELARYVWHSVGRLDVDTTGLLLFSNDERFVELATSPETHVQKRYVARVFEGATDAQLQPLRDGVMLDDGPARPATAVLRAPGVVVLTLTEGRFHQAKRMLGLVGLPVLALHREAIGELQLDVPEGAMREVNENEFPLPL